MMEENTAPQDAQGLAAAGESPTATEGIADESAAQGEELAGAGRPGQQESIADGATPETPAPEPYALTVAEDFPMPSEQLTSFTETCRKAGLSRTQAEALLGWHRSQYHEDTAWRQQQEQQIKAAWDKEILEDKDFGGSVKNYKETVAAARRALGAFDVDGSLRELLKTSQGQFHPAVVKTLARIGRALGEHTLISGNGHGGTAEKPLWQRMYGE